MTLILTLLLLLAPIHRSSAAVDAFKRQTGYPHGRPGYVVDHKVPLCAGGPDTPDNMQWQTLAESRAKDRFEDALCRELKRQHLHIVVVIIDEKDHEDSHAQQQDRHPSVQPHAHPVDRQPD